MAEVTVPTPPPTVPTAAINELLAEAGDAGLNTLEAAAVDAIAVPSNVIPVVGEVADVAAGAKDIQAGVKDAKLVGDLVKFFENPEVQAYLKVLGQDGAKVAESLEEKGLAALKDVARSSGGKELLTKIGVGAAALGSGIVGASLEQGKELIGRIAAPAWEAAAQYLTPGSEMSKDGGKTWKPVTTPVEGRFDSANGSTALFTDTHGNEFEVNNLSPDNLKTLSDPSAKTGARLSPDGHGHGHLEVSPNVVVPLRPMLAHGANGAAQELRGSISGTISHVDTQTNEVELQVPRMGTVTVKNLTADAVKEIEAARDQHPGERATITALRDGGADVQVSLPQHVQHTQAQQAVSR